MIDAVIVAPAVQPAERGYTSTDEASRLLPVCNVGAAGDGLAARGDDVRSGFFRLCSVDVVNYYGCSKPGGAFGACGSDAPPGTCDDDGFAFQQFHFAPL